MRACEGDAHDTPGRLESEARIEGYGASFAAFCAGFACNRVKGGGVAISGVSMLQNKFHPSLSFSCG